LTAEQFLPAFARELQRTFVDGAAGAATGLRAAMNRAGNTMMEVKQMIGAQLAPVVVDLSNKMYQLAGFLKENWSTIMAVGKAVLWAGGLFATFKLTVGLLSGGVTLLTGAMTLGRIATLAFTGQFAALNLVMAANPIGLVATAITALIGVFTWAYNKFEWFKGGVWGLWEAFKEVFSSISAMAKDIFGGITSMIAGIFSGNFGLARAGLKQLGGSLGKIGSNVAGAFSSGYQAALAPAADAGPKVPNMPEFNMPKLPGLDYPGLQPFMPNGTDAVSQVVNGMGGADSASSGGRRSGIEALTGGGKQVTNISIHSPKLADRIEIEFATVEEGMNDLEGKMQEVLARALNNFTRNQQ
jgi:hypothetical protein